MSVPVPPPLPVYGRVVWLAGAPLLHGVARAALRLQVQQQEALPDPPYVVAANHLSHLDPPLIGVVLRRPVLFLALDDLFHHRVLGFLLRTFGAVPLPRGRVALGALRAASRHLSGGGVVVLFPEGRRVRCWGEEPPRRGAAWLAARHSVPLVPVAISGTDQVLGLDNRPRPGRLRLVIGPPLTPGGRGREPEEALLRQWAEWMDSQLAPAQSP